MGSKSNLYENDIKLLKESQTKNELSNQEIEGLKLNLTQLRTEFGSNNNYSQTINNLAKTIDHLTTVYTQLASWKAQTEQQLNQTMMMLHYIHEQFTKEQEEKERHNHSMNLSSPIEVPKETVPSSIQSANSS